MFIFGLWTSFERARPVGTFVHRRKLSSLCITARKHILLKTCIHMQITFQNKYVVSVLAYSCGPFLLPLKRNFARIFDQEQRSGHARTANLLEAEVVALRVHHVGVPANQHPPTRPGAHQVRRKAPLACHGRADIQGHQEATHDRRQQCCGY
jgi:hypothetical protein